MASLTSSSLSMPRSGIRYAYQDLSSNVDKVKKFSKPVELGLFKVGDVILIVLRDIYKDPKSPISFPDITTSNACLKIFRGKADEAIGLHEARGVEIHNPFHLDECSVEVLKPELDHPLMIETLGVKMFSQLQSAFRDADTLLYSFLKQPTQNVNLFKIKQIKDNLITPVGDVNIEIEDAFRRIQSIIGFLFTTLSAYETCALQKKPLHQLNFMQLILTSTPLPSPLIEEIMSYVDDDCEIPIKYEVDDNFKKEQQQLSKTISIFSCFDECRCW